MKIKKVKQVIEARSQGSNEAILLLEFLELLKALKIPLALVTEYNKRGIYVGLDYNYKQLKEKLKKFRGKKLLG